MAADSSEMKNRCVDGSRRPTIPQSITPIRPSRSSIMFPACTSPWNAPQRTVVRKKARITSWTSGVGSYPSSATLAKSSIGTPSKNSMVSTLRPERSTCGLGNRHQPQVELVLQTAEVHERTRLVAQVHLLADLDPEPVEQLQHVAGHLVPRLADQDLEERLHEVEVGGDDVLDVGPQHLDGHDTPVEEPSPVHDRDGGGADGFGIELGEGVAKGQAEVLFDPLAHVGERDRRARCRGRPGTRRRPRRRTSRARTR